MKQSAPSADSNSDPDDNTRLVRGARWLEDFWPQLTTNIGNFTGVIATIWLGMTYGDGDSSASWLMSKPMILFYVAAAAMILGGIGSWKRAERVGTLKTQLAEQSQSLDDAQQESFQMAGAYKDLLDFQLKLTFEHQLEFTTDERVSVYKHDGQEFTLLCRYSPNPQFRNPGRSRYPDDQGCIAEAWQHQEALVENLPDPNDPQTVKEYEKVLADRWRIPVSVSRKFNMKSRWYAGLALHNHRGYPVAVMVCESTRTDVLNLDELKEKFGESERKRFADFIEQAKIFETAPGLAQAKGF